MTVETKDLPESNYLLDYDDTEKRRLREQHDLIKAYTGKLILAPLDLTKPNLKILDSGTFDGHWLTEAAKPLTTPLLTGTDISPAAFPNPPPQNTSFHIQSITDPWPASWQNTFDLVHQRLVLAGTTPTGGLDAVRNLAGLAKPGGWVQLIEGKLLAESQRTRFPALHRFHSFIERMLPGFGWNIRAGLMVGGWLGEVGLEEVGEMEVEIPVGRANGDGRLGAMAEKNLRDVMGVWRQASSKLPADSPFKASELEEIFVDWDKEIETIGSLLRFAVVWGRRPALD
uniref:N-methyltransferase sirN n=1 Tax=Leptosphaeria maculans TaxID=5022 RepID=SIRN_LEPMC|nr:RecName: Full=N-methyltransferase sirN; AltName: Full=Sirodesmin biosynthesis protein N [Plenodomus lingam]